jgi:hypothetical protein
MIGVAVNTSIATGAPLGIAGREAGAAGWKGGSRSKQPERTMYLTIPAVPTTTVVAGRDTDLGHKERGDD